MVLGQGLEKITCGKKWDRRSGSFVQQELVSVPPASKLAMMMSQWAPHISTVSSCLDPGIPRDAVPLGLESYVIPNSSITASSTSQGNINVFGPARGRLHMNHAPGTAGAWCADKPFSNNEWIQTFQGNVDSSTVVYNALPRPQNCQAVRVAPIAYRIHICLRLEVYEQTPGVPNDVRPLGMESEDILNSSLQISGSASIGSGALWRLNHNPSYAGVVPSGYEWIQVDLLTQLEVVGIATQGSKPDIGSWVTSYKVSSGTDGVNFDVVQESCGDMIFTANWDCQTVVFNRLPDPLSCRYLRLLPISWNSETNNVFRIELYAGL
ncbi:lactadherin-like [Diadema setosum]|uniref:lactadherin-like n=1 Tax=Diadema setosum TaxID=31175 RepID=UPI003B39FAD1